MFIRKTFCGMILVRGKDDTYDPPTGQSSRWKHWITERDPKVCSACEAMQGKIYSLYELADPAPPLHPNCRCEIEVMKSVIAGFGTKDGINGADWWIKHNGRLPDYYISKDDLYALGYKWGKPPRKYAPGMMMYGGIYETPMVTFLLVLVEFGTKRISTTTKDREISIGLSGQMTV